ncbi:ATP-binding cassette domain-containing protein [Pikeienuella piscinae]|uniref:ATP-binding cassette domain-containing protein n=1 Tax=Pikeienuella piscinae TaxID=2748098 RepID=A0A7L5BUU6_9RHOB|nr:ATP-binding cassette domain-containing protein [Pikeienuella piscinae]QIE54528.1 ATP-binding cassette domain-containing protein [Pikeienuella piscinae]
MSPVPKIEMRNVAKAFGANEVLRGVDLSVAAGESLVIIGGSGTGKSVTIKTIIGLIEPDSGDIKLDGVSILGASGARRDALLERFGMLFQGGALFDSMPVWRNVAFRLLQGRAKRPVAEARSIAIEKLRRVGLQAHTADLYPAELSGGMQKRVGLARAIAADPEIIFFDEPTAGLDPIMASVINKLIRSLVTEIGATAITITHDMRSVVEIADQVAMIHEGRVQWRGPVDRIENSGNAHLDQFIHGREEGPIEAIR